MNFIDIIAGYIPPIKAIGTIISALDVLTSFAQAAAIADIKYVRPKMLPSEAQQLHLVKCRHPCLEMQEGVNYIANSVEFSKGILDKNKNKL